MARKVYGASSLTNLLPLPSPVEQLALKDIDDLPLILKERKINEDTQKCSGKMSVERKSQMP